MKNSSLPPCSSVFFRNTVQNGSLSEPQPEGSWRHSVSISWESPSFWTRIAANGFLCIGEQEEPRVQSHDLPRDYWRGQEEPDFRPEARHLRPGGYGGCGLLYPNRQSEAHRRFQDRQRSYPWPFRRREFLWRRCAGRSDPAHGIGGGHDGL